MVYCPIGRSVLIPLPWILEAAPIPSLGLFVMLLDCDAATLPHPRGIGSVVM